MAPGNRGERQALAGACAAFEEALKRFIRDPRSGDAARIAAQCLFTVRGLENALSPGTMDRTDVSVKMIHQLARRISEMWHHAAYAHHVYHHAASPEGHWLAHTVISALIHGLIYGAIFHLMRGMGIGEVLLVAALGVLVVGGGWWLWNRR